MSNFQERFKGKTSTISKEGLISSLDKPPISKQYVAKVPGGYPQNIIKESSLEYGDDSPFTSQQGNLRNDMNKKSIINQSPSSHAGGMKGSGGVRVVQKQQISNSNFSSKSEKSEKSHYSKVSASSKFSSKSQLPSNDPYIVQNQFPPDQISLFGGYNGNSQAKIMSNGSNIMGRAGQQLLNELSRNPTLQNLQGNSQNNGQKSNSDKRGTPSKQYGGYTVSNNAGNEPNIKQNSESNQNGNSIPKFNPYTLEAIENSLGKKNNGKPNLEQNASGLRQSNVQNKSSFNQNLPQENEANEYMQAYVPSFSQVQQNKYIEGSAPPQRGGLGANLGNNDWNQNKGKINQLQELSGQKQFNSQQMPQTNPKNSRKESDKRSSREKVMEFTKNSSKPSVKSDKNMTIDTMGNSNKHSNKYAYSEDTSPIYRNRNGNGNSNTQFGVKDQESEFEMLERQHLEYLNKVEQLNQN